VDKIRRIFHLGIPNGKKTRISGRLSLCFCNSVVIFSLLTLTKTRNYAL